MKWPFSRKRRRRIAAVPAELVQAIQDVGIVYRSFVEDEDGIQTPRPMTMSFLGSRPMYLDDPQAVAKLLRSHWPELTDRQVSRALAMIGNRVATLRNERQDRVDLLKTGRRRRKGWMRDTENLMPWEL
ncbi:hypothetical protein M8009_02420 [Halomonas sp. ATCH28]|uniref:Uncharacterized protein n=1 Tax=Halomonas gemina TaxID=2945105 RepID=A0ABT0SWY2_9GAMM|nr:hypothetical protein [Halomonas gemina]MCL7939161.1 hypothetical protein [Halomonas gemina]